MPFGRYAYTSALQPQVAHVPVIVPLAWFGMGLPAREAAHAALGRHSTPATRVVLGSAAMTAWDLFLDPQMVGEGYWAWASVAGSTAASPLELRRVVPDRPRDHGAVRSRPPGRAHRTDRHDVRLVGQYGYMSVMQTLGFARYFRDPLVAVVGGIAMLPIAATAATQLVRRSA